MVLRELNFTENAFVKKNIGKILKMNSVGKLLMKSVSEGNVKVGHVKVTEDAAKGKAAKAKITEGKDIQSTDILREPN